MLQPYGSRHAVRQLLLWEDGDPVVAHDGPPRAHAGSSRDD
jgi:putative drug exporter of the RND superfamily